MKPTPRTLNLSKRFMAKLLIAVVALSVIAGCNGFLKPHKMAIQQGNIVTEEMLSQLKVGMTPSQVKYVLGTPMIVDTFQSNKWHYLYSLRLSNGDTLRHNLEVVFENNKLASFDGDYKFDLKDAPKGKKITSQANQQSKQAAAQKSQTEPAADTDASANIKTEAPEAIAE